MKNYFYLLLTTTFLFWGCSQHIHERKIYPPAPSAWNGIYAHHSSDTGISSNNNFAGETITILGGTISITSLSVQLYPPSYGYTNTVSVTNTEKEIIITSIFSGNEMAKWTYDTDTSTDTLLTYNLSDGNNINIFKK